MKLHFHKWGKWSEPLNTAYDYHHIQVRYCDSCNKCHVKKIREPWNIWFNALIIKKAQEK